ncbi:acyltransferase family protein [Arenimonas sp. MALMAid1274]|uniref:acyltransferase family protein n=1 Tax=Arenimonas sp. MALMAid1274 TaxID=3411630 RepID=UPI003BA3E099
MAKLTYRPEIDGLRAIAVVLVVLYHADPRLLPGGFIGVDVFFVISGYLITSLLADEWKRTGRIDFPAFYARRIRRLLPALVVVVVAVVAAAVLLIGRHGEVFEQTGDSAVAALLLASNLYFDSTTGGYFDSATELAPMQHLWSLSVEEQFYLVYPLMLALLLRWVPQGVARRLAVLSVMSLLLAEYWVHIVPQRAFYQMPARFWELSAGAMVALSATAPAPRSLAPWYLPAGVLAILSASMWTPAWPSFPGLGAMPAVLGSALVLLGIQRGQVSGHFAALLRTPVLVGLGLVSYSLYLWHWPLLAFDANVRFEPSALPWRLALCLLAVGLAWLSWRYVEQPLRRPRGQEPGRTILAGGGATLVAIAAVLALMSIERTPVEARRMAEAGRGDHPAYMANCHFDALDEFTGLKPASCRSRPAVEPTVALWGDSHAMAWQPFTWHLAAASGQSAAGATMNACRASGLPASRSSNRLEANCAALNAQALAWLESGNIDTLVIGLRWPLVEASGEVIPDVLQQRYHEIDSALVRLRQVRRVILIGPVPLLKRSASTCLSLGWDDRCAVSRAHHDQVSSGAWQAMDALARVHPNVVLIDPTEFLCNDVVCPVARDGYSLYWDNNHVSATASAQFAVQYLREPARYTRKPQVGPSPSPQESP